MNEGHTVSAKEKGNESKPSGKTTYEKYTLSDLENALNDAIQNEDYERASLIRDEIKKRH
jgi:hypothetical protein